MEDIAHDHDAHPALGGVGVGVVNTSWKADNTVEEEEELDRD